MSGKEYIPGSGGDFLRRAKTHAAHAAAHADGQGPSAALSGYNPQ
ncbi:hypothetical protein [Treponema endosymbiont of Eucomonympha sp.]|nr:hypothetical protein [Treponema endosymbiont of Eucomonympha sp.]